MDSTETTKRLMLFQNLTEEGADFNFYSTGSKK